MYTHTLEVLTDRDRERLRAAIDQRGAKVVARDIGVNLLTLYKALAGVNVHRLTVRTIRAWVPSEI